MKTRKKGLYIAFEYFDMQRKKIEGSANGIEKKIINQLATFEKENIKMDFWNPYEGKKHSIHRVARRLPFYFLNHWEYNISHMKRYDFIYVRKAWFMDGDFILFLKKVKRKKPEMKVILEIPTYPYDGEGKKMHMMPLIIKDCIWRRLLRFYVDRIVTYSRDRQIFNIPAICIPNGICTDMITPKKYSSYPKSKVLNLIACSSLYYWHGYDRAICGLGEYYKYKQVDEPDVVLHIVGNGEEMGFYKKLVVENRIERSVILYGEKTGKELDAIYDKCEIGLDSMGRHRSGVAYNSSLKGKEYCAKGLIVVSGVRSELDYDKEYKYYYRVPANDEPIHIRNIINFINNISDDEGLNTAEKNIREYAERNFDFSMAMKPVLQYVVPVSK